MVRASSSLWSRIIEPEDVPKESRLAHHPRRPCPFVTVECSLEHVRLELFGVYELACIWLCGLNVGDNTKSGGWCFIVVVVGLSVSFLGRIFAVRATHAKIERVSGRSMRHHRMTHLLLLLLLHCFRYTSLD